MKKVIVRRKSPIELLLDHHFALLEENCRLKSELETREEAARNYRKHILWLRTSNDKKPSPAPCPFCGSTNIELDGCIDDPVFFVWCHDCDASGPEADHEDKAILAWNKVADKSNPGVAELLSLPGTRTTK